MREGDEAAQEYADHLARFAPSSRDVRREVLGRLPSLGIRLDLHLADLRIGHVFGSLNSKGVFREEHVPNTEPDDGTM